ncbi:MAG: hypothetical protein ACR2RB_15680, partial [Gammaproteobacteria bacterium]
MAEIAALDSPTFADTRAIATCSHNSIAGAICLHPSQFLYPDGRPASFRDINWLVGTYGLDSSSTVVVVGDTGIGNYFVAGM